MPRECVVHTTKCAENTTIASARIARFLADKLGCPLYDGTRFDRPHVPYRMFYVNSMGAFADPEQRELMRVMAHWCDQLIYVQNDYTIHPISQTQKVMRARGWSHDFPFHVGPVLWTTVPGFMVKEQDSYINWNALTYDPLPLHQDDRERGVVYWGSYRQDREDSFQKYLGEVRYPVHLCCATPVSKKFQEKLGRGFFNWGKWKEVDELNRFEATVYIEDDKQHGDFHSLANRFYEALSAGLAIFIDRDALTTFEKTGLVVDPFWVVSSSYDVESRLPYARSIALNQRVAWDQSFRDILDAQVEEAYRKL